MYSRHVDGQVRTFGVSGKLWHGVLVLFDRQSGSLWTQLDGRAIQGADQGARLEHVPSTFTVWSKWREAHPETLVLDKSADERAREGSAYADYFEDPDELFLPHLGDGLDSELGPKHVVFGVRVGADALAVAEEVLEEELVVNAHAGPRPVALALSPTTGKVVALVRSVDGRELHLQAIDGVDPTVRLRASTGETLDVTTLEPLRVDRAYWYAWGRTVGRSGGKLTVISR